MATKTTETVNLIDSFSEFKETKNIDRATLVSVLEECFRSVIAKIYGSDENYDVIVNPDKGDFEIYRNRKVVPDGEVKDPNLEISLSEARAVEDDYEVGEEVSQLVKFSDFGRAPSSLCVRRWQAASSSSSTILCTISTKTVSAKW